MEKLDLCKILKGHEGKTFYSPTFGNIKLTDIVNKALFFECTDRGDELILLSDGKWCKDSEGSSVFPSKDQRDWNKWIEEQRHRSIKTWNDYMTYYEGEPDSEPTMWFDSIPVEGKIGKSCSALFKIHRLIEVGYEGNVTKRECINPYLEKYEIIYDSQYNQFLVSKRLTITRSSIAFHTEEQAMEFLKYHSNVQLIKDYYMI